LRARKQGEGIGGEVGGREIRAREEGVRLRGRKQGEGIGCEGEGEKAGRGNRV